MRWIEITAVAAAVLLVGISLYLSRRLARIGDLLDELRDQLESRSHWQFVQLEALLALYSLPGFDGPLPRTRGWAASPDFLLAAARLALQCRPNVIVECGSGASTLVLARCLATNACGHIYSLENDPAFAQQTRDLLLQDGTAERATVIDAPLSEVNLSGRRSVWYDRNRIPPGPIDLLIIDGPPFHIGHQARYPAGPVLFPQLSDRGVALLDDANRKGEQEAIALWREEFPDYTMRMEPGFEKGLARIARTPGQPKGT